MSMDNRKNLQRISKADLLLADLTEDNGLMPTWHAEEFVRLLMLPSVFMGLADVRSMRSHTEKWPRIGMTNRALHRAGELQTLPSGKRSKVETEFYELTTTEFKGAIQITDEVLEDNIEREQLVQTCLSLMAEKITSDMEELFIKGDTTETDDFLASFDGLIKLTTSNVVPISPSAVLTPGDLKDSLKIFPQEYLARKRPRLRYMTAPHVNLEYGHSFGTRETMMGDDALRGAMQNSYSNIPFVEIPHFPIDLGAGNDSVVILADPKDFKIGIHRNMKVEFERDAGAGATVWYFSTRIGCVWEYEPATAKITGVLASS